MKKIFFFLLYFFISNSLYSNEIQILSEIVGDGIEISNHSKVSVHYIGKLEDLSEFDNSYIRGEVFKFQVGTRQVIPGWETGLLGMKEGGKRTIFIPYKLAYGDRGVGNSIPPKSNLIFEIEVLSVTPPKHKNIDSLQFKLASSDSNFIIIDIRYEDEIKKSGIIPNSMTLPAFDQNGNCIISCSKKYYRPAEVDTLLGNSSKAKKKLKWKPKISFQNLVKEMIDYDYNELKKKNSVKER